MNFLSFISKNVKNYPRFLGISTIFFQTNASKRGKAREQASGKEKLYKDGVEEVTDGVKSTYLPKNATFYNLHVQGEGACLWSKWSKL